VDKNDKPVKLPFKDTLAAIHSLQSKELPIPAKVLSSGKEWSKEGRKTLETILSPVAQPTTEQSDSKSRTKTSQEEQEVASEGSDDVP